MNEGVKQFLLDQGYKRYDPTLKSASCKDLFQREIRPGVVIDIYYYELMVQGKHWAQFEVETRLEGRLCAMRTIFYSLTGQQILSRLETLEGFVLAVHDEFTVERML